MTAVERLTRAVEKVLAADNGTRAAAVDAMAQAAVPLLKHADTDPAAASLDQYLVDLREGRCRDRDPAATAAFLACRIGGDESPETEVASNWPTLDPAAFHGIAGDLVMILEQDSEAAPVGMLLDFLVGYGNMVGPGPAAQVGGSRHPARLFVVKVGRTSRGRKTQGWADVRQAFTLADEHFDDRLVSGLASGEGLIAAVRDPDDDDQGTVEKRCLVVEPEWARVLAVAQRDGSTLSAVIRECWDTGNLRVLTRKQPLKATGAHVSFMGHITLDEVRRRLTETEVANGYGNRHLFCLVDRARLLPSGPTPDADRLRDLATVLRKLTAEARKIGTLTRTPAAEERWTQLYHQMAEDDTGGLAGAITARAEAQCLRLSVAYALADASPRIDLLHLEAAWAVWRYCEASARYIFGDGTGDEIADRLLAHLRRAGPDGMSTTDQSAAFGRHVPAKRLNAARELLESKALIATRTVSTEGRAATVSYAKGAAS